jgi:arginine repressor
VEALESGEEAVSELQEYTAATQAMVSRQLMTLEAQAVINRGKKGSHVYHRANHPKVTAILACIRSSAAAPPPAGHHYCADDKSLRSM